MQEDGSHKDRGGGRAGNAQCQNRNERTAHQAVVAGFRRGDAFRRAFSKFFGML